MGLASSILQWCGLARKILHIVVASLPDPANCARCRADGYVCRPWRSFVHRHVPEAHQLPWIALWDNFVIAPCTGHAYFLPNNAMSVGSTDHWLVLGIGQQRTTDDKEQSRYYVTRNYVLHNPFSNRSLPLSELDAVIVEDRSLIRKFLMRSTVDDFIAVITDNWKHPLIVFQRGKGVWSPEPWETPYTYIIDTAFLGEKLYAITTAEDLIPLDLALDGDGRPMVTMGTHVIKQLDYDDSWTTFDEDGDDQSEEEEDEEEEEEQEEDNDDEEEEDEEHNDLTNINSSVEFAKDVEPDDITIISQHFIESHGKLLMVRHRQQLHPDVFWVTLQVNVFEADFSTHAWVTLTGGLGSGRALFVSMGFSKSVPAPCGEVEEDGIYFMDTGDVFNMKSGTSNPSKFGGYSLGVAWLFPPELGL